jgi:hypothetical protein
MNTKEILLGLIKTIKQELMISLNDITYENSPKTEFSIFRNSLSLPENIKDGNYNNLLENIGRYIYTTKSPIQFVLQELKQTYLNNIIKITNDSTLLFMIPYYGNTQILSCKDFEKICGKKQAKVLNNNKLYHECSGVIMYDSADDHLQSIYQNFNTLNHIYSETESKLEAFGLWFSKAIDSNISISTIPNQIIEKEYSNIIQIENIYGKIGVVLSQGIQIDDFDRGILKIASDLKNKFKTNIIYLINRNNGNHNSILLIISDQTDPNTLFPIASVNFDITTLNQKTFTNLRDLGEPNIHDFIIDGRPLLKEISYEEMKSDYVKTTNQTNATQYLKSKSQELYNNAIIAYTDSANSQNNLNIQQSAGIQALSLLINALVYCCYKIRAKKQMSKNITTRMILDNPTLEPDIIASNIRNYLREIQSNNFQLSVKNIGDYIEKSRNIILH